MWESIGEVLTSGNAIAVLAFLAGFAIIFAVLARMGIISIKAKGVTVGTGSASRERAILRKQVEYVGRYCLGLGPQLETIFSPKKKKQVTTPFKETEERDDGKGEYYYKYIAVLMAQEIDRWVLFNHISTSAAYLSMKEHELKAFLISRADSLEYSQSLLDKFATATVTDIMNHLARIRKSDAAMQ